MKIEKIDERNANQSYKIDARPFLEKTEKEVTKFLVNNPNYFNELKLQKTTAWDFTVGSTKEWHATNTNTKEFYTVPSTCRAVGTHCYIFVEDDIWNVRATQTAVDGIKNAFDNSTPANGSKGIYQIDTETFGTPPDVDNDPKIIILILDIKDGYTGSGGYVAGYFHSVNEVAGTNSNMAEIYYLDANPSDLTTEAGLNSVMSTTAHEFQHMIHFNYHNGTDGKPQQTTFMNEACSEVAEVVNGYPIRNQTLYNNEFNIYLEEWRDDEDVLSDYTRASRYMTYMYDQFGSDFLGKLVQSSSTSISGVNDALSKLSTPTDLRVSETLENWFMANILNDKSINPAWDYTTPGVGAVNPLNHSNPNFTSPTITVANLATDYISFSNGENLSIQFDDFGSGILKFKAIKYNVNNSIEIEDISANTQYAYSDFGTTYKTITFAIMNTNASFKRNYKYTSTGDANIFTLAYDENEPSGVLPLTSNDTVCVVFDGIEGGQLDSIRVALRQAGSVHGGIYEFTGTTRPTPLGKALVPDLTVISTIEERPAWDSEAESYPIPFPNWITVDLTSSNIDVSNPFVAAFVVEGTYPENNRIMITEQPDGDNHSFTYLQDPSSGEPDWYYLSASETTTFAYLIRAYVSFGVTDVEDQIIDILPMDFNLSQNYPNPFNPTTVIKYAIPTQSNVLLKVYNILGKEVSTLVNEEKSSGNYEVNFNANNLASGIYYYTLKAGSFTETKKMILLQ
ncbi:MAG: T9SS type A sorting domain-containing protein [Ignavibacteriae bacterium]|nr:T9SS type A sorting domain-containing protein [Ignavibacteriota bacterium]